MVQHYNRLYFHHQLGRKFELSDEAAKAHNYDHFAGYHHCYKKSDFAIICLVLLFGLLAFSLLLLPRLLPYPCGANIQPAKQLETPLIHHQQPSSSAPPCSSIPNNSICCDRTAFRTDVCFMRGDIRTHSPSNSLLLITPTNSSSTPTEQKIKPYTRKWETNIMSTIDELTLSPLGPTDPRSRPCDVYHDVPAVIYSTGGYTGNVYHEFNDGIIPLYITSNRFDRKVVFILLEYHEWWITKYKEILDRLSDYPPIDFTTDKRTHCFSEVIVGARIHNELTVDPRPDNNRTIWDFRTLIDRAYAPPANILSLSTASHKPKLVIISRKGSRKIENERRLAKLAETVGFRVNVLRPNSTTKLAEIFKTLSSCDVMVGVHGAAMTHFLFMKPGAVFVQIVPLGTEWAARTYYGEPAEKMGLKYVAYKISPEESSLFGKYPRDDPVLRDPKSVNAKGWQFTKRVYLDGQNVRLDLGRFRKVLVRAHREILGKRTAVQ